MLALGGSLPISPYVTTISFLIYVVCRIVGGRRSNRRRRPQRAAARTEVGHPARDLQKELA
jgi:zinc/manganese transport system permease protein